MCVYACHIVMSQPVLLHRAKSESMALMQLWHSVLLFVAPVYQWEPSRLQEAGSPPMITFVSVIPALFWPALGDIAEYIINHNHSLGSYTS